MVSARLLHDPRRAERFGRVCKLAYEPAMADLGTGGVGGP